MSILKTLTTLSLTTLMLFVGCGRTSDNKPQEPSLKPSGGNTCVPSGSNEPIVAKYAVGDVASRCDLALAVADSALKEISAIPANEQTLENTLLAFEKTMANFSDDASPLTFQGYVSTEEAVSTEGSECEQKVGEFYVDVFTRRPLYDVLAAQKSQDPEISRLLYQTLQGFEQNGLKLSDQVLQTVKTLKTELSNKENQFTTNLNTDNSSITLTEDELAGATADFLGRLKKDGQGNYIVTTKGTDYVDLMQNVSVSETRRRMQLAYLNKGGAANTQLLQEAVQLRSQIATALGFANWADYRTAPRMAKSSTNALNFLLDLKSKLTVKNQQDFAQLLAFKKELDSSAKSLDQWDIAYLSYQLQKRDFSLDNEKIKEYFRSETVVQGIFDIYSKMLGVKFVEVTNAKVWSPDVKLYEIHSGDDCALVGYFYADLVPRPGKYGHAAAFPLISGRRLANGKYSYPVASMVANFSPPTGDKPALLSHDDVETFFHEFGHIMHQTLTRAPFASLSGTSVAQDFVEAPSQMLENWVWNTKMLSQISGHYLRPEEKLPEELLQKMIAARNFQLGASYTKQLLYALFDMTIHSANGPLDVTQTYDDLYRSIVGQEPLAGNHFPGTFGHMMGGYDAGYYGYLWSEVYAQDMFTLFPSEDVSDATVGMKYRKVILEQGNMKEALDLLKEFLGREPSTEAFFKKLGL